MTNPLLNIEDLPPFSAIKPEHVEPAIDQILEENRRTIENLLNIPGKKTWTNLIVPMEDLEDRLARAWSPVSHMNSVVNSNELRDAYNACLPKLSQYATEMGQNRQLYEAIDSIANGPEADTLNAAQRKALQNDLRDFRLSGVDLPDDQKKRFMEIQLELATLTAKFSQNVLEATQAWTKHITDEGELVGLPDSPLAMAKQTAEQKSWRVGCSPWNSPPTLP